MDVNIYIPGHGFIEEAKASREELVEYQKALKYVIEEVQRLHKLGLSPDDARKQANWGPYKEWISRIPRTSSRSGKSTKRSKES